MNSNVYTPSKKLLFETLEWIDNIDSSSAISIDIDNFFYDGNEDQSILPLAEYNKYLLHYWGRKWFRRHHNKKNRNQKLLQLIYKARVVIPYVITSIKIRKWQRYTQSRKYIHSFVKKIESDGLKYYSKQRLSLLYWHVRTRKRRNSKNHCFKFWVKIWLTSIVYKKFYAIYRKLIMRTALERWRRRSKWPNVIQQRLKWLKSKALLQWNNNTNLLLLLCDCEQAGSLHYIRRHWPHFKYFCRRKYYYHARVKQAAHVLLQRYAAMSLIVIQSYCAKKKLFKRALESSLDYYNRRKLSKYGLSPLRHRINRIVQNQHCNYQAYLHFKRRKFLTFIQRCSRCHSIEQLLVRQSRCKRRYRNNQTSDSNNRVRALASRTPGLTFMHRRGNQLWCLPYSPFNRWRRQIRSVIFQGGAQYWAYQFLVRSYLRGLRRSCRRNRNSKLRTGFAKLVNKERISRRSLLLWRNYIYINRVLYGMMMYARMRWQIRSWRRRKSALMVSEMAYRRAELRFPILRLQTVLKRWNRLAVQSVRLRRCFAVFRRLHPIPYCSSASEVFLSWKNVYHPAVKNQRIASRLVIQNNKYYLLRRLFSLWDVLLEDKQHRRSLLQQVVNRLYGMYWRKYQQLELIRSGIMRALQMDSQYNSFNSRTPKDSIIKCLQQHAFSVRHVNKIFAICFKRRIFSVWYAYTTSSKQHHNTIARQHSALIAECNQYFGRINWIAKRCERWTLWRSLRHLYHYQYKRQQAMTSINIKLLAREFFYRWIDAYNAKIIAGYLQVPGSGRPSTTEVSSRYGLHLKYKPSEAAALASSRRRAIAKGFHNIENSNSRINNSFMSTSVKAETAHKIITSNRNKGSNNGKNNNQNNKHSMPRHKPSTAVAKSKVDTYNQRMKSAGDRPQSDSPGTPHYLIRTNFANRPSHQLNTFATSIAVNARNSRKLNRQAHSNNNSKGSIGNGSSRLDMSQLTADSSIFKLPLTNRKNLSKTQPKPEYISSFNEVPMDESGYRADDHPDDCSVLLINSPPLRPPAPPTNINKPFVTRVNKKTPHLINSNSSIYNKSRDPTTVWGQLVADSSDYSYRRTYSGQYESRQRALHDS